LGPIPNPQSPIPNTKMLIKMKNYQIRIKYQFY
jgi:hypothetical protein